MKVKQTYAPPRFAVIRAPITSPDHDLVLCPFFCTKINHRVSHRRIVSGVIRPGSEQQVDRTQIIQFERVRVLAQDCAKGAGFPHPNLLAAGIARHDRKAISLEHVENIARAIHPTVCGIVRTVSVCQILGRQNQCRLNQLPHPWQLTTIFDKLLG